MSAPALFEAAHPAFCEFVKLSDSLTSQGTPPSQVVTACASMLGSLIGHYYDPADQVGVQAECAAIIRTLVLVQTKPAGRC